mmetsp:Transcript_26021/g.42194  ORF Transcript_26021/g.42194 Transcript_26021/m.42194 type:complete len:236 (+) Transcript_26021:85-792(+)
MTSPHIFPCLLTWHRIQIFLQVMPEQYIWTNNVKESPFMKNLNLRATKPRKLPKEPEDNDSRWWTRSCFSLECPLTGFPIRLLPYPPFKLRVDPLKPSPQILIDGKFLAMQLIVDGKALGLRQLVASDIHALDTYIQRCKLGPWRPGIAQKLAQEMMTAPSKARREQAAHELQKMRMKTRSELRKLHRIQENRLSQLVQMNEAELESRTESDPSLEPLEVEPLELADGIVFRLEL